MNSYTSWVADFSNSRCSRTVDNSYAKVIQSTTGCWKSKSNGNWWFTSYWQCSTNGCMIEGSSFYSIGSVGSALNIKGICSAYSYTYHCPNGGTLGSTLCTKIDAEYKLFSSF